MPTEPTDLIAVPGLRDQPEAVRRRLVAICVAHYWPADWLAALIAHESGWKPWAANPGSSAVGLIQFTEQTAESLGTSTRAIGQMTALAQLDLVEAFFVRANGGNPIDGPDFMCFALGVGNLLRAGLWTYGQPLPADGILYPAGSDGARGNKPLQSALETITVASVRHYFKGYVATFSDSPRLPLAGPGVPLEAPKGASDSDDRSVWYAFGAMLAAGWAVIWLKNRSK